MRKNLAPTCGDCVYWHPDDEEPDVGECYFLPPVVMVIDDQIGCMRPAVEKDERICGQVKGKQ